MLLCFTFNKIGSQHGISSYNKRLSVVTEVSEKRRMSIVSELSEESYLYDD